MRLVSIVSLIIAVLGVPGSAGGQDLDYTDLPGLRTMANTRINPQRGTEVGDVNVPSIMQQGSQTKEELPEEKPEKAVLQILFDTYKVDPDQYMVGPDDQLSLYLFGELEKEYTLTVNPEGIVNIPTVGPVDVSGKSLSDAKKAVRAEVAKKYKGLNTSVSLSRPRYFRVHVSGIVRRPGLMDTHALQRVSDVIDQAGLSLIQQYENVEYMRLGETRRTDLDLEVFLRRESSQRSIIIHRGGKDIPVDLQMFRRFGDTSYNPYVCAGDNIEVPPYLGNMFASGEVNQPGRFEFKPGDRIVDLIRFAGGITTVADTLQATLVRFDGSGTKLEEIPINLYDALINNPGDPKYLIDESDRLLVKKKYGYKTLANVTLRGEVKYPGTYPITPNVTTLKDIVTAAGGPTEQANLEEARFIRSGTQTQDLEYERLRRMTAPEMTEEEYDYYKNVARSRTGEISVDFNRLFTENDARYDVLLENNDTITIPAKRALVRIMGAVQQPGFVKVEENRDAAFYITQAGGYNWNAAESKTRIIKARTGQRFRPSKKISIEAGDTIHIPEKKPLDLWGFTKDATLVFANMATIIILARQLKDW